MVNYDMNKQGSWMQRTLFSTIFLLLCFVITPVMAESVDVLVEEATEDYHFMDYEAAEVKFLQVVKSEPNHVMAHYYLGTLLMIKGDADGAIPHFEQVLDAPEAITGIEDALVKAYVAAGKDDQALLIYKKRYASTPNDANAFQYAKALQTANHIEQARAMYHQLIDQKGEYAEASRYQLGLISYKLGSFITAHDHFKAINPSSSYGDAAKQYMDALTPMTQAVSTYVSAQYFYTDNANAASTTGLDINAQPIPVQAGSGTTLIGSINSRQFEISEDVRFKIGYLFYGSLYASSELNSNDFMGHFINPSISYRSSPTLNFELKADYQYFDYNHQQLSQNYGVALITTKRFEGNAHSMDVTAAYLKKAYSNSFIQSPTSTASLEFLDANHLSAGLGGTLRADWGGSLTMNYKFTDEQTINNTNVARDARNQNHTLSSSAHIALPQATFGKYLSRVKIIPSFSYIIKDYTNPQSVDTAYDQDGNPLTPDLLIGEKVNADTMSMGLQILTILSQDMGLILTTGYEQSKVTSNAASLNTKYSKYFASLSATF